MTVPVYLNLLVEFILLVINEQDEISLLFKDVIQAFGSIISLVSVLLFLYVKKFIAIFFRNKAERIRAKKKLEKKATVKYKRLSKVRLYGNATDSTFSSNYSINK